MNVFLQATYFGSSAVHLTSWSRLSQIMIRAPVTQILLSVARQVSIWKDLLERMVSRSIGLYNDFVKVLWLLFIINIEKQSIFIYSYILQRTLPTLAWQQVRLSWSQTEFARLVQLQLKESGFSCFRPSYYPLRRLLFCLPKMDHHSTTWRRKKIRFCTKTTW